MNFDLGITLNRSRSRWQNLLIKYLEYEDRCNVGFKRGQIENNQWAVDWPYVLLSWMTLKWPTSKSLKLHVKYCENGDRYNDCVHGSQTGVRYRLAPQYGDDDDN